MTGAMRKGSRSCEATDNYHSLYIVFSAHCFGFLVDHQLFPVTGGSCFLPKNFDTHNARFRCGVKQQTK